MTQAYLIVSERIRRAPISDRISVVVLLTIIAIVISGCRSTESSNRQIESDQADPSAGKQETSQISLVNENREQLPERTTLRNHLRDLPNPINKLIGIRKNPAPHLGKIYSRAAQFHDGHRNPVILIPGILGSRLTDSQSGRIVWGQAGFRAASPKRANEARLLALPMESDQPLAMLSDHVVADTILGDAEFNFLGIPLQIHAYRGILSSMGVGGYRNDSSNHATLDSISYGQDHYTCFEFHYDWRRSNSENAARLGQFMKEKTAYVRAVRKERFGVENEPVRFDIIAHSMGGLIARYFLRYGEQPLPKDGSLPKLNWAGAHDIETLILVGTPNAGAVDGLQSLVNGMKYSPILPKYPAAILGTMPSIYQLLPRPRHHIIVNAESGKPIDLYDWQQWRQLQWGLQNPKEDSNLIKLLPDVTTRSERKAIAGDHLRKSLAQAKQFHQALDITADPPEGTSIYLIAGDAKETISRMEVHPQSGTLKIVRYAAGDETVLRSSAIMDERLDPQVRWSPRLVSPITWRNTTFLFTDHLGLTSDPAFTDNILYLLLESPR